MNIPWESKGKLTHASRVGASLVPIGVLPRNAKELVTAKWLAGEEAEARKYILRILGSAIQLRTGNLLTPRLMLDEARRTGSTVYVLIVAPYQGRVLNAAVPVVHFMPYVDPRTNAMNTEVDAMLTILPSLKNVDFERSHITWGDSRELGVGDAVMVAGYPMGSDLFFECRSNRGVVQPNVYAATISSIIPAQNGRETRLLRVTVPGLAGMSGGVVFNPKNGTVLGMIVSATHAGLVPQPALYAIPSEALDDFSRISFRV